MRSESIRLTANSPTHQMLGLYIHVPFCSAICNYCNFNRGLFDADLKARYVDALLIEIRNQTAIRPSRASGRPELVEGRSQDSAVARPSADTIYFGGGTPSLLEPADVARIVRACEDAFDLAGDREVTLEANPETVTEARLAAFRDAGVNRLSFGVQSFRDDELRRLSRLHSADRAGAALGEARAAGFDNVSLDLMMWLPEQRVSDWLQSVDAAIGLEPDHLSLYLLELYPNAPLKDEMARARWSQAPDEDAAAMYLEAMARLEAAGLEQYEISNVARPGRRSRHNLKYWTDGEWLGIGCGAHSTRRGSRWKNIASTTEYIEAIARGASPAIDLHVMTPAEQLGDALFTGLRLVDGIDTNAIQTRYGVDVWRRFGADLEPFVEAGCLRRAGSRLRLTRQGMLLAHEVMTVFV
jgi:oxygen-independent coproporphyrinogen-3 oxidase